MLPRSIHPFATPFSLANANGSIGQPLHHEAPIPLLQHLVIGVGSRMNGVVREHGYLRSPVIIRLGVPGEDGALDLDHFVRNALGLVIVLAGLMIGLVQGQPVAEQLIELAGVHGRTSPISGSAKVAISGTKRAASRMSETRLSVVSAPWSAGSSLATPAG